MLDVVVLFVVPLVLLLPEEFCFCCYDVLCDRVTACKLFAVDVVVLEGAVVLLVALFSITNMSFPLLLLILAVFTNCTYFNGCYSLVVLAFSPPLPCLLTALLLAAMIPDEFAPAKRDVEVLLFVLAPSFITPAFFLNNACAPTFVEEDVIDVFGTEVFRAEGLVLAFERPTP